MFLLIRKCALRGKKSSGKHLNGRRNHRENTSSAGAIIR